MAEKSDQISLFSIIIHYTNMDYRGSFLSHYGSLRVNLELESQNK